jgi:hypothetical protein
VKQEQPLRIYEIEPSEAHPQGITPGEWAYAHMEWLLKHDADYPISMGEALKRAVR